MAARCQFHDFDMEYTWDGERWLLHSFKYMELYSGKMANLAHHLAFFRRFNEGSSLKGLPPNLRLTDDFYKGNSVTFYGCLNIDC